MYADQQAKLKQSQVHDNGQCAAPMDNMCAQAIGRAVYTLSEEAQRNEQFHCEQAQKAHNAACFLASHPEFEEFIRLVRAGALQF